MHIHLRRLLLLPLIAILTSACATTPHAAPAITHVVLISLAEPAQSSELVRDCETRLAKIPSVVLFGCGPHVDIGRANIDGDYDIGVVVGFDSVDAYKAYLAHPMHEELVAKWRPRWKQARIFDIGNDGITR